MSKVFFMKSEFLGETITTSKEFFEYILFNTFSESFEYDGPIHDPECYKDKALETEYNNILKRIYEDEKTVEIDGTKFTMILKEEK